MPVRQVIGVLAGCFAHLSPDGAYYQFTYGARCPVPRLILERLGLKSIRIGRTFSNFPPAAVYRINRRPVRKLYALRPQPRRYARASAATLRFFLPLDVVLADLVSALYLHLSHLLLLRFLHSFVSSLPAFLPPFSPLL